MTYNFILREEEQWTFHCTVIQRQPWLAMNGYSPGTFKKMQMIYGFLEKKFKLISTGLRLLYDVALVFAVQESKSAIRTLTSFLFWVFFPFRSPRSI